MFCANQGSTAGAAKFDAEGGIDHSSPYKGTAERSSATKKPHIKMEETHRISSTGFNLLSICIDFNKIRVAT